MQRSETPPDSQPENEARKTVGQTLTTQHRKFGDLVLIFRIFYKKFGSLTIFLFQGDSRQKKIRLAQNPSEIAVQIKDLFM